MKGSGVLAWLFYAAIRTVFAIMQCFPLDWNLRTARILARIWPLIWARHRQRAIANLAASFPGRPMSDLARLADASLASVAMFAVEAVCLPRLITPTTWMHYVRLTNFDPALRILLSGRGAVLVTGHYGSFELVGHLLAALGFPVAAVMRPLDNDYINRFIVESRRTHGLKLLDKKGASAKAHELLAGGTLIGFIADQDAGKKGLFVEFFNRPASTYKSIGLLAMAENVPIIVGYARREGNRAFYEVGAQRIIEPAEWATAPDPLRWITQEFVAAVEQFVRDEPSQYLWAHQRWKHKPPSKRPATATVAETHSQ